MSSPIYGHFIGKPIATALFALGLVVFGSAAFVLLPVAALPEIEYPTVEVEAQLPGASADTVAATVAAPLERQLAWVRGIVSMTSTSWRGSTQITLQLDPSRSVDAASLEIEAAIANAASDLPSDLPNPPYWYRDNPADWSVLGVALTSSSLPLTKIDQYADTIILRRAALIPGVRRTVDWSRQRPAVRVEVNPPALAARGISLEDVRQAIRKSSIAQPKGSFDSGKQQATISANDQLYDAEAFSRVVVASHDGAPVRLGEVARVFDGAEDEDDVGWFNGERAIEFGFKRVQGANIVATVDNIRERLPAIAAAMPPGIKINIALDRSTSIRAAIRDVELTLAFTTLLVVLVIFVFLRSFRATLIPSIAIPVSLVATFIVMYLFGYSLDNLSLMALTIAVGFVVDDAIVVIENIARHIEAGEPPEIAARRGVEQVGFTIISITLSLAAVFIPVLLMGGVVGRLFREFGVTVSAAILISALVSLVLTPMMCARFLKPHRPAADRRPLSRLGKVAVEGLGRGYGRSLDWVLGHRHLVLLLFAASVVATGWLYVTVPKGFFPRQDTGRLNGTLVIKPDLSSKAAFELAARVATGLRADPDTQNVMFFPGGDFFITLQPAARRHGTLDQIMARLKGATSGIPGAQFYLQPQPELVVGGGWSGHAEYQYMLTDASWDELNHWAPILEQALGAIPGLRDVAADQREVGTEVHLDIDRDVASRLGVDVGAIDDTLYDAFGRRRVREVFTDATQYYVTLQAERSFRLDERALETLYVKADGGALVPIGAFAKVRLLRSPATVRHEGQLPAVSISFNLDPGVSLGAAVEAIHAMEQRIGKPVTLQTAFAGTAGEFERSLASQPWLIGAAILVVYIVLGMLYESLLHPLTILSTLPSAGIGALLLLTFCGYDLSVIAIIGILLLIGIVKKNAIMMVDFAIHAEREGSTPEQAIRAAATIRFRPIMMTTLAALVGALPLALGSGPGFELRRPLGIAIAGGLMLSQLLTLYTTPVIYLAMGRAGVLAREFARRARGRAPAQSADGQRIGVIPPKGIT